MELPLNRSLIFLCLGIEDLYSRGIVGSDDFECDTLCDFCISLDVLLGHNDSIILSLLPTNVSCCCQSHSVTLGVQTTT